MSCDRGSANDKDATTNLTRLWTTAPLTAALCVPRHVAAADPALVFPALFVIQGYTICPAESLQSSSDVATICNGVAISFGETSFALRGRGQSLIYSGAL